MHINRKAFIGVAAGVAYVLAGAQALNAQGTSVAAELRSQESGALVVLSGTGAEAVLIDPIHNRVLARFPTGPNPRGVALSPDGRFAYVTSYSWDPAGTSSAGVTVLDLESRQVHAVFQPGDYRNLGGITVGTRGQRLWMTTEPEGGVVELDAHTGEVKMLWKTGSAISENVTVSHDGRRVYVSNTESNAITIIDRITVVPSRIATGQGPTGLALTADGRDLWVANSGDNTISLIKGRRRPKEVDRFPSGGIEPVRVSFHPGNNQAWVSNRGSRTVTVLDATSHEVLGEIALGGEPRSIRFSSDGHHAYVLSPVSQQVFVIDVATRRMIEAIEAGSGPSGLAWSRHGNP